MAHKQVAPYGTWSSPISSDILANGNISLSEILIDHRTGAIYAVESRPAEGGRGCLVQYNDSNTKELLSNEYNIRSKVHGYGGGACAIGHEGQIVFTDFSTNGIYIAESAGGQPRCVLPGAADIFYADFDVHPNLPQWIIAVQVQHNHKEEIDTIVAIDASTSTVSVIAQGCDFYSSPRFSRDGSRIAWNQWNHPDMPWTGTQLFVADWKQGHPVSESLVAGQPGKESICQPRWSPHGELFFVSDRTGYWQLYRYDESSNLVRKVEVPGYDKAEFGARESALGNSTYVFLNETVIVVGYTHNAVDGILALDLTSGTCEKLDIDIVDIQKNSLRRLSETSFTIIGSTPTTPAALYIVDIKSPKKSLLLKSTMNVTLPEGTVSVAEHIEFPRTSSSSGSGSAYAVFIPPLNPSYTADPGTKPPLIAFIHGGPTSHIGLGLQLTTQYWTSRGYAYVYVNHAGSTGYGREYRDSLDGKWGLLDADDAADCVTYLAGKSKIDPSRVGIMGGSAGGYTTMQALCRYPQIWAAGVSYCGIANLKMLAELTHKFEAHYMYRLVFKNQNVDLNDQERVFKERSPITQAQNMRAPLLLLQGRDDVVVSVDQAIGLEQVMKTHNATNVKLMIFDGEGHGFRKKESLKAAVEAEGNWWGEHLLEQKQ